ncbi:response regulator [Gramella sp. MT6]|uniref:hybrid sensor histidine kinase/response regulator transcription factor n=1 Tax=Gramella sp. MT6 TaxID=2705471 RepID=UPI001C5DBE56|nr:hybrid sensor histidine kinase/response regulator transcription factor [Gramella sp. MT6]QYA26975.1 response regulator [Gramella sp. MT6]
MYAESKTFKADSSSELKVISPFKFKLFLFSLTVIINSLVFAQENKESPYQFETLEDLPTQRAVASISQDEQGFIWMGTNGLGLNKFNGVDFISYQYVEGDSTSLSNSLVHYTYIDNANRLWVGTETGLDLYNREQDNFIHIPLGESENANISVQAMLEDEAGNILVGTHQYGIFLVDPQSLKVSKIKIFGINEVRNLLINSLSFFDDKILLGTDKGLFEFDKNENKVIPANFMTSSGKEKIETSIKTMELDGNGDLWLGTISSGLYKIDENENGRYVIQHFPITSKRVLSLQITPRNTILCGTENDGMFELDANGNISNRYLRNKFSKDGIRSNSIWSLFLDDQERIWIGYYNNGLGIYDKLYDKFQDISSIPNDSNSLQANSVTGILKDDQGRLWIAMDGGGIDVYKPRTKEFIHLLNTDNSIATGLNSADVQTIFKDRKGNIWVGTWDYGIYFLKESAKEFINYTEKTTGVGLPSNRILSFSEDSKGIIWIGTYSNGIISYNPSTEKFKDYDEYIFQEERITYSDVRTVYVDSEDNIWFGGNSGLFKLRVINNTYDLESMSSRFFSNTDHPYNSLVMDIYEDSSKNLWIGTEGHGLCRYDMKADSFTWMDAEMNFNKITASSIIEDDAGNIWVAGNNGLARLNRDENEFKNYTINDGLLSNDFNSNSVYKDEEGKLYFGSYEGVNYFHPENLSVLEKTPRVYLSDLKIFNQPVHPGDEQSPLDKVLSQTDKIQLNHEQSVFTIDYAAIDYTRPEKIQFAYYLEGFEDSWNYVQNTRSATYTNLPAGNYIFHVKAANSDGVWNDEPTSLNIKVLPPWWFTRIAILGYVLLFFLLIYVTYRVISSRIKTRRAIAQERERYLQEEALNDKKIQFFTNISHEFRTPLTLIMSPLEDIMNDNSLSGRVNKKLNVINKNTIRLKRLIDELMDFRKLQVNRIPLNVTSFSAKELLLEIEDYFKEEAEQRNIVLSLEIEEEINLIYADRGKLEKIIFNILSNAFKSTGNNGIITMTAAFKKSHFFKLIPGKPVTGLEISIEDTGKGIDPDEIQNIFDRFYQIKDRNEQYYSGTGIGLEVVRSFVELHKGEIEVESEVGVGTKFRILIPMDKEHLEAPEVNPATEEKVEIKADGSETSSKTDDTEPLKKTLLVVEDNLELRNYIKESLTSDYKIVVAEDGVVGLEKAKKYMPDVVITDVIMPKMDGYEFCAELKKDLRTSHIPVLMLTAKAMTEDWVEGLDAGADVYLNKPFQLKILRSHLKQLVSNRALLFNKYMGDVNNTEMEPNATSLDQQFILDIMNYTRLNIRESNLNVEKLADEFNLSRSQLYRKIKALTGLTANELIRKIRLERANELLRENSEISISEISYKVGFSSPSYFSKCFKDFYGKLPKEVNEG